MSPHCASGQPETEPTDEQSIYIIPKNNIKEVIQPHVPVRLPCYDFTPITNHNLGPE